MSLFHPLVSPSRSGTISVIPGHEVKNMGVVYFPLPYITVYIIRLWSCRNKILGVHKNVLQACRGIKQTWNMIFQNLQNYLMCKTHFSKHIFFALAEAFQMRDLEVQLWGGFSFMEGPTFAVDFHKSKSPGSWKAARQVLLSDFGWRLITGGEPKLSPIRYMFCIYMTLMLSCFFKQRNVHKHRRPKYLFKCHSEWKKWPA